LRRKAGIFSADFAEKVANNLRKYFGERIFWGEEIGAKFSVLGNFVPFFFLKVSRKVEFLRIIRYICKQEK
jgi:hypothetical protein